MRVERRCIIDADRDEHALYRRIESDPTKFPPNRILPRFIPPDGPIVCWTPFFDCELSAE